MMYIFIKTFGCQQNVADSQRIASYYVARGYEQTDNEKEADLVVINSCMIREKAEERVYGYIRNLRKARGSEQLRIVLTGCIVGAMVREPSGKMKKKLEKRIPDVELLSIDEVGFEYSPFQKKENDIPPSLPLEKGVPSLRGEGFSELRKSPSVPLYPKGEEDWIQKKEKKHGWVIISNGCNNYCAFCIVPFSRGKEKSRPYEEILSEVRERVAEGYTSITLLGQNVNSYGADLIARCKVQGAGEEEKSVEETQGARRKAQTTEKGEGRRENKNPIPTPNFQIPSSHPNPTSNFPASPAGRQIPNSQFYTLPDGRSVSPIMVKHLGRHRIPTLFPYLLEDIAKIPGLKTITFTSSNPWDFSDELIDVIARNKNIDRLLHLPVQSGSTKILQAMNRWYTREEYAELLDRIVAKIPEAKFMTDIIVGFPGETEEDFQETVDLVQRVGFVRAFIACYSPRPGTHATKNSEDVIEWSEKKRRMQILNAMINLAHRGVSENKDWIRRG